MDLKVAVSNWKNLFRNMVGLPKQMSVKVMRNEAAKQYPLIQIKKDGDVGYDLPSTESITIPAATPDMRAKFEHAMNAGFTEQALEFLPKAEIPTGIHLEMLNNTWCSIETRSSASKKVLITPDAIIDAGYRGELFAVVYNFGHVPYKVEKGERIVQVIFHERVIAKIKEVDSLSESERGITGFGSTGN